MCRVISRGTCRQENGQHHGAGQPYESNPTGLDERLVFIPLTHVSYIVPICLLSCYGNVAIGYSFRDNERRPPRHAAWRCIRDNRSLDMRLVLQHSRLAVATDKQDRAVVQRGDVGMKIPFNKPYMTGKELWYIAQAHANGHLAGDGEFTRKCNAWLEARTGAHKALLSHSCTAALEMAAILCDIRPGDEVIMPSFTFVSTANAFVLRGGVPVFIDIRPDTLNIDETKIEEAITEKTKAIVPVHYAGVSCEMDAIMDIAQRHNLLVVEDAAQGVTATYKARSLGSIGNLGTLSFHETKNVISGEGGALLVNDRRLAERAEIIREKGTNRSQFFRGQVDKYTWVDVGSSWLPSELIAAFLWAQLEEADAITKRRLALWEMYHQAFRGAEADGLVRRPIVPSQCTHNAHMYYLLLHNLAERSQFIARLKEHAIVSVFHYVPLHSSPMGKRLGRPHGKMKVTDEISDCLVRLPLWLGMEERQSDIIRCALESLHLSTQSKTNTIL